jgi:hypothetical protein
LVDASFWVANVSVACLKSYLVGQGWAIHVLVFESDMLCDHFFEMLVVVETLVRRNFCAQLKHLLTDWLRLEYLFILLFSIFFGVRGYMDARRIHCLGFCGLYSLGTMGWRSRPLWQRLVAFFLVDLSSNNFAEFSV